MLRPRCRLIELIRCLYIPPAVVADADAADAAAADDDAADDADVADDAVGDGVAADFRVLVAVFHYRYDSYCQWFIFTQAPRGQINVISKLKLLCFSLQLLFNENGAVQTVVRTQISSIL